jgi:hypothetical protein
MLPDYAALNMLAHNDRTLHHSGAAFMTRVVVDALYVIVFPAFYLCRMNDYFHPVFTSISWFYLAAPLNLAIILNYFSGLAERSRDTDLKLQATDSTTTSRTIMSVIDAFQSVLGLWLVSMLAVYFDSPPSDPDFVFASDYSLSSLSIFIAVVPLWTAIGVVIVIIPKLPAFNRSVVTLRMFAALTSCYLGVIVFFIAPLVLFCLKYNNYHDFVHKDSSPVILMTNVTTTPAPTQSLAPSTSTITAVGSLPLTLIVCPILVLLVISHVLALSNVAGHYNRLMRGYARRTR